MYTVMWPLLPSGYLKILSPPFKNSSPALCSHSLPTLSATRFTLPSLAQEPQWASPVAQKVKNPPAMRETWVRFLGWEDALEKGKATQLSILAWRNPWTVQSLGIMVSQRAGHDWTIFTSPAPSNHSYVFCPYSCSLSRMSYKWNNPIL